jgi:hypothetical protein
MTERRLANSSGSTFKQAVDRTEHMIAEFAQAHKLCARKRKSPIVGASFLITRDLLRPRGILIEIDFREQEIDVWSIQSNEPTLSADFPYLAVKREALQFPIPRLEQDASAPAKNIRDRSPRVNEERMFSRLNETLRGLSVLIQSLPNQTDDGPI